MAFSQFKSLAAVAREFQITTRSLEFMGNIADVRPDASLQKRLSVTFAEEFHKASEAARCEFLITPFFTKHGFRIGLYSSSGAILRWSMMPFCLVRRIISLQSNRNSALL
jgi:hypothetical protein